MSCGSYYNKIRKQPVDRKAKTELSKEAVVVLSTSSQDKLTLQNDQSVGKEVLKESEIVIQNRNLSISENSSDDFKLNQTTIAELNNDKIPQDSLTNQEILDIALAAEKKSGYASLCAILGLVMTILIITFIFGIILGLLGLVYVSEAKKFPYNTQKGEKDLKTATAVLWAILALIITFTIIILLLVFL